MNRFLPGYQVEIYARYFQKSDSVVHSGCRYPTEVSHNLDSAPGSVHFCMLGDFNSQC
jgi:hypothetical protein